MLCVCKDALVRHQSLHECLRSQLIYSYPWHLLRTSELPPEAGCQAAMADCCGQNNRSMHCDVQIFSTAVSRLTARVWLLSGTISSVAAALQLHPSKSSFLWSLKAPVQLYQHHTTTLCWHQTAQATVKCLDQPHVCKYFLTYSIHTHTYICSDTLRVPLIWGLDPISTYKISEDSGFSGKSFIFQAGTTSRPWERSTVLRSAIRQGLFWGQDHRSRVSLLSIRHAVECCWRTQSLSLKWRQKLRIFCFQDHESPIIF